MFVIMGTIERSWTNEEKIRLTDWINQNYLDNQNFGSVSKADFELFLFSLYFASLH